MKNYSHLGILRVSDQANLLGRQLSAWAEPLGGTTKIVANVRHLWEEVYARALTASPGIYICFVSATARGPEGQRNDIAREDRMWKVVIMRGHGFRNKMAKDDEGGGAAQSDDFYTHCETIRDMIRVNKSISNEFPIDYRGMSPLPGIAVPNNANIFLDGYGIDFSTANDIGEAFEGPPQESPDDI